MKIDEYIYNLGYDIELKEQRLRELKDKFFKWGKESEIKMLEFLITKEKKTLEEAKDFKKELTAFK